MNEKWNRGGVGLLFSAALEESTSGLMNPAEAESLVIRRLDAKPVTLDRSRCY